MLQANRAINSRECGWSAAVVCLCLVLHGESSQMLHEHLHRHVLREHCAVTHNKRTNKSQLQLRSTEHIAASFPLWSILSAALWTDPAVPIPDCTPWSTV